MLLEKSAEGCGSIRVWMDAATLPPLEGTQRDGKAAPAEQFARLGLAELVDCTPVPELLNDGREIFRALGLNRRPVHRFVLSTVQVCWRESAT
jgi:hypothetical protein